MNFLDTVNTFTRKNKTDLHTFAVIFTMGLLVHLSVITNKFFNYFEMGNILMDMSYAQGDTLVQGRWFIPIVSNLFTTFSTPLLNGVVCLTYMGISAVLIIKMIDLKEPIYRYLFGGIWVSFPGMASIFSYGVNADVFCFCIFTAVLSVYLCEQCRWGVLWGSIVLCFSIGAYQPYLAMAIAVAYCILFFKAISGQFELKLFCKKTGKLLGMLLLGFILYYLVLQAMLFITGISLSNYHGVDNMISFTPKGIAKGLVYTYGYFISYLFTTNYTYTIGRIIWNVIGAIVFLVLVIRNMQSNKGKGKQKTGQLLIVILMVGSLPLGLNASPFLMADRVGNGVDRYMLISIMLLWAILLKLLELLRQRGLFPKVKFSIIFQWAGVLSAIAACVTGVVICNEAYHRLDAMTTTTESMLTRIVGRMEEKSEWNKDIPVYFVNPSGLVNDNYDVEVEKYEALKELPGTEVKPWYNERAISNYMRVYLHFPVKTASEAEKNKLDKNVKIQNMPSFPAKDSIQIVNGVMVVKISDKD